jgi:hypothetical protein
MKMPAVAFATVDWATVETTEHQGREGVAVWRTRELDGVRVRLVEYSAGYASDHWCSKGHVLLCLEGELRTELQDGRTAILTAGMSYHVGDGVAPHRSSTVTGAKLFIVD